MLESSSSSWDVVCESDGDDNVGCVFTSCKDFIVHVTQEMDGVVLVFVLFFSFCKTQKCLN